MLKKILLNWKYELLTTLLLTLSLLFFQKSNLDLHIQEFFFNRAANSWLIDRHEPMKKLLFYNLPKIFLGIAIITSLIAIIKYRQYRSIFVPIFLCLTLIPLIVGNIKKFTNIYCPCQLSIYDGQYPYVKIFDKYPPTFQQEKKGKCFPAGHVVSGFCLFILCFLPKKRSNKLIIFILITLYGLTLGFYQIAKGVHFLSDTIISMLICLLLTLIIARLSRLISNKARIYY